MKNYIYCTLRICLYLGTMLAVELFAAQQAFAVPENIIFYNGSNQTFNITLRNMDNNSTVTVAVAPGANNLGVFEETSYTLTMPYMHDVVSEAKSFYWGCNTLPGSDWIISGDNIILDDYWLTGDCINLITLDALPNQVPVPDPSSSFDLTVYNGKLEPFDVIIESQGFVDGEAYQTVTLDTGVNHLGLFNPGQLKMVLPRLGDVLSGSTKVIWDCSELSLTDLTVKDWNMWTKRNIQGNTCNYTIAFMPQPGDAFNPSFQNNTQLSFAIKMIRRTGQVYTFNIVPGLNNLGTINSGEYELYMPYLPELSSGAVGLSWEGNMILTSDWTSDSYGTKLSWKSIGNTGSGPQLVLNSDAAYTPTFNRPDYRKSFILTDTYREPVDAVPTQQNPSGAIREMVYYDGLGRPNQTLAVMGSPNYNDVITPVAYDALGREATRYLPYAGTGNNTSYRPDAVDDQAFFYAAPIAGITQTLAPYSETRFEASPLNRVLEQGAPGEAWQLSQGHTVRTAYSSNIATDVKLYHAQQVQTVGEGHQRNLVLLNGGYYDANQLYITVIKDENWTATQTYQKAGAVEEYKDKQGKVVLKRTFNEENNALEMLSTYYVYDDFGNLSFVLPPGINPDRDSGIPTAAELNNFAYRYHYDGRNRLVEKQLPGKGMEYIVYNELDHPILTQDSIQRTSNQWLFSKYDALGRPVMSGRATLPGSRTQVQVAAVADSVLWETVDNSNTVTGYRNITETYPLVGTIDDYMTINYYDNYNFPGAALVAAQNPFSDLTKSLPTGSKTYTADGTVSYLSASYYDSKGRMAETVSENHVGGVDRIVNTYNFPGELLTSIRTHTGHNQTTVIGTRYTYDHMGRKLKTVQYINNPADTVVLSQLAYNEIGQLMQKKMHSKSGGPFQNTESYSYNPRGWLKSQSGPRFAMELKYEDGTVPQYNGNISNQYWGTASNPALHNYSYLYDKLNRLSNGISDEGFNETINYDKMGNIVSLNRNPMGTNTYSYSGNRLTGISGAINSSYTYDANGNQTGDSHKGITLAYNYLNLPQTISKPSSSETMTNTWLATGTKIRKTVGGMTREYVGGIEYNDGQIEFIQTAEGRAIPTGSSGYRYEYMLKDHLGNTRVLLEENGTVLENSDYYPFGLQVARGQTVISPENRYKYNGKELQTELGLGQYDYGARFYDPVIGRWNVVDPKAELVEMSSPYVYSLNSPVNFIDKDGELPIYINGRVTAEGQRGDKSYWDYQLLRTIAGSGIPNPGGESHFVDGDQFQYGSNVQTHNLLYERVPNAINKGHYADGGNRPGLRSNAGYTYGKADFKNVLAKLARDPKTGKISEKIQIYTHSRGAAFGAGYTEALLEMIKANADQFTDPDNVIDFVYNMGPHQSNSITSPSGVDAYSHDHTLDALSGNDMGGLKGAFSSNETSGGVFGPHSTSSFKKDVAGFLKSWQSAKGDPSKVVDDFVKRMKREYGINVTGR